MARKAGLIGNNIRNWTWAAERGREGGGGGRMGEGGREGGEGVGGRVPITVRRTDVNSCQVRHTDVPAGI